MKNTVKIAINSSCFYHLENRPGKAIARVQSDDKVVYRTLELDGTTDTRIRIQILIDIIKELTEPTHIILYGPKIGLRKITDKRGQYKICSPTKINADLLNQLQNELLNGGHDIEEGEPNKYKNILKQTAKTIENQG